jgi:hypothetical protein
MKRKISPVPLLIAADFNAAKAALEVLKTKTSWRLALTGADKRKLFKLGPNSLTFVNDAQDAGEAHPNSLRKKFNMSDMISRQALKQQLGELLAELVPLTQALSDTESLVGADLMQDGLDIYEDLQKDVEDEPGLVPVVKALGKRFEKTKTDTQTPPPSPPA